MDFLISLLISVMANVSGYYICKWLETSPSGSWKTLHGVVKRSLILKIITKARKKDERQLVLFSFAMELISLWLIILYPKHLIFQYL